MASILDQYEQASARGHARQSSQTLPQPISTGIVNARLEDDTPIFNKQRINFNPSDQIIRLVSCNNYLVMAMSSNILQRINLEHPDQIDEIEIPKAVSDQISQIFLDPTGRHLIISMTSSENYYLARSSKKPRPLGKLKGHQITVIGWNKDGSNENSTGEILLGTSRGLIVETEIVSSEDGKFFQASLEQYVKQLYNLGVEYPMPVTGLEFQKMESTSLTEYRYFVMATTPGRLYQFLGTIPTSAEAPIFQHIFSKYEHRQEQFLELPGEFGFSQLRFHHLGTKDVPKSFAWMTGPGVYFGNIDVTGMAGENNVTVDTKLIEYPPDDNSKPTHPLGMVLTEFHVLLVFPDRLKAVCVLNEQLILDDVFASDRFGKFIGMWRDPEKGTIWTYTNTAVFKYKVIRESRDVWQMYLDAENFEKAKKFCKDNPANMDRVLTREAEHYFKKGQYKKSAEVYAQTHNSFEEVALRFIQLDNKDALKGFLLKKMAGLKPQDRTQLTMIVTWVIEIYLNQLGLLKEQGNETSQEFNNLQEEFRNFLSQAKVKDCLNHNRSTIYDLIASHGDLEDMIFFAVLMQDYERVITHHIQHENYKNALDTLAKQSDVELFYKFSPLLMQNVPKETVDAWMSKGRQLDSKQLIPALVQYDHLKYRAQGNEAIRYLEYCVQVLDNRDQAIHNYLISLYAQLQPERLMKYLHMQGQDLETVCYDLKYALRLCAEHGHNRACVHIYSTMGLYEEAVDLALQVDVDLAKQNAERPEDEELMKKLWLKIACHVVEEEKDIKRAMEMVHECNLLKIEDILPFFPDFVTIDHFKDAICTSLQEYNQHIESLKEDMEEATESAKDIRGEIQAFRNKYSFVKGTDKCSGCGFPLMTRAFYVFPCMHRFHSDCLIAEVLPHLVASKRIKVEELQRKLASRDSSSSSRNIQGIPGTTGLDSNIKDELDDLVAGECIYCGDIMIRSIDRPFVEENEFDGVAKSWL